VVVERLAQDYETMFERNIGIIASRKQEVQIESEAGTYEGFVCGLDDVWVQLYGHESSLKNDPVRSWRLVLLNKDNISSIITTGRDNKSLPSEVREQIEKRIYNFSNIADKFIEESKKKPNDEEGR
jgi:hypothetical protein